jgi:hypothetical protein
MTWEIKDGAATYKKYADRACSVSFRDRSGELRAAGDYLCDLDDVGMLTFLMSCVQKYA